MFCRLLTSWLRNTGLYVVFPPSDLPHSCNVINGVFLIVIETKYTNIDVSLFNWTPVVNTRNALISYLVENWTGH